MAFLKFLLMAIFENSLQILASQECSNDGHDIFGARIR